MPSMPSIWKVLGVLAGLAIIYLVLSFLIDGYWGGNIYPNDGALNSWKAPDNWAEWRDIMIVTMGVFWALAGALAVVLLTVLIFIALLIRRILKENAVPAIDSLKDTLDNVRGTAEFASETVASPLIRTYSVVKGVRRGAGVLSDLPGFIGGRRRKGK